MVKVNEEEQEFLLEFTEEVAKDLFATAQTKRQRLDHRTQPRSKRTQFLSKDAIYNIRRDYLGLPGGTSPPLLGADFKKMFRISRTRFQVMMEDIMAKDIKFYRKTNRTNQATLEAKLLLPLRTMAYGVGTHTFRDYFQMSAQYARDCCKEFHKAIKLVYMKEYLRLPTSADLKAITNLHKSIHGVEGMVGSLDCTHTYWKNCPKAWQGSYKGKERKASIALEAMSDYHLFFWHVAYGYVDFPKGSYGKL
jgi:hypothetical protein